MNRKDFFKCGGRWVILSGIGVFSTCLAYNNKIETPDKCKVAPQCDNCARFVHCKFPQAYKEKRDGK